VAQEEFGGLSETGNRPVGRLLTEMLARGRQGRSVLRYGYEALVAPHNGRRAPARLWSE